MKRLSLLFAIAAVLLGAGTLGAAPKATGTFAIFIDNGQISVGAPTDMNITVTTTGGALVKSARIAKGSTITVRVPAGIYLVNGVKVLVK